MDKKFLNTRQIEHYVHIGNELKRLKERIQILEKRNKALEDANGFIANGLIWRPIESFPKDYHETVALGAWQKVSEGVFKRLYFFTWTDHYDSSTLR